MLSLLESGLIASMAITFSLTRHITRIQESDELLLDDDFHAAVLLPSFRIVGAIRLRI